VKIVENGITLVPERPAPGNPTTPSPEPAAWGLVMVAALAGHLWKAATVAALGSGASLQ